MDTYQSGSRKVPPSAVPPLRLFQKIILRELYFVTIFGSAGNQQFCVCGASWQAMGPVHAPHFPRLKLEEPLHLCIVFAFNSRFMHLFQTLLTPVSAAPSLPASQFTVCTSPFTRLRLKFYCHRNHYQIDSLGFFHGDVAVKHYRINCRGIFIRQFIAGFCSRNFGLSVIGSVNGKVFSVMGPFPRIVLEL